jgi:hypothetical protein
MAETLERQDTQNVNARQLKKGREKENCCCCSLLQDLISMPTWQEKKSSSAMQCISTMFFQPAQDKKLKVLPLENVKMECEELPIHRNSV